LRTVTTPNASPPVIAQPTLATHAGLGSSPALSYSILRVGTGALLEAGGGAGMTEAKNPGVGANGVRDVDAGPGGPGFKWRGTMSHLIAGPLIFVLGLSATAVDDGEGKPATPTEQYRGLLKESQDLPEGLAKARTAEERKQVVARLQTLPRRF